MEYKAQGRGRLGDPSGCIAVDFRQVPMEIAMVGRVGRTEIKAQEEGGREAGGQCQAGAGRGKCSGAECSEPGDVSCQVPHLLLWVQRG